MSRILELLNLAPSPESIDYVEAKDQFHLHGLLTEQRHEKTWDLGFAIRSDTEAGLRAILSVDEDLSRRLAELARDPGPLEQAVGAIVGAVRAGRTVYVYGCGATGRLAKQMESAFWRPFWKRLEDLDCWSRLAGRLRADIADAVVGEMTGADRALVSSLEGFEDLRSIGELQLEDHGISAGDVVICVTEGGETSSVIGTILGALAQYGPLDAERREQARRNLYFVYNNPDDALRPFERSRTVLDEPAITRINLTTGPQAIAGSTRMQATTIETFVVGVILEEAAFRLLREELSLEQLEELGYRGDPGIAARLAGFDAIRTAVDSAVPALAKLTELEAGTYERGGRATYFARRAMVTVFTDCTERSPTFRLFPLDEVDTRRSWVQVWTDGETPRQAWQNFLGRPFHGFDPGLFRAPLEQVADPWLRKAALSSLANAGDDQELRYDFSLSDANLERRGPRPGDLGVLVLVDEERAELAAQGSGIHRFRELFRERGGKLFVVHVSAGAPSDTTPADGIPSVDLVLAAGDDPLAVRRQIAVKILLNAHSTATMALLGRVIGNTMTNVSPSNLKLVGRATFLVMTHVNDALKQPRWIAEHGPAEAITFAEANAVLMDAVRHVRSQAAGQTAEVALCIVRILESLRLGAGRSWEQARAVLDEEGLAGFLVRCNPALDPRTHG